MASNDKASRFSKKTVEPMTALAAVNKLRQDVDDTTNNLVIGTNVQAYDAGLDALSSVSPDGFVIRSAADTFVSRSIAGTTNEIDVANGDGKSATPTLSLSDTLDFTAKDVLLPTSTPTSASATGTTGQIVYDGSYIYVCVATDTWVRAAITTW